MDGSRARRTRDPIRKAWYASHRQRRFARHYGFGALKATADKHGDRRE
jgi:hypothetical protein